MPPLLPGMPYPTRRWQDPTCPRPLCPQPRYCPFEFPSDAEPTVVLSVAQDLWVNSGLQRGCALWHGRPCWLRLGSLWGAARGAGSPSVNEAIHTPSGSGVGTRGGTQRAGWLWPAPDLPLPVCDSSQEGDGTAAGSREVGGCLTCSPAVLSSRVLAAGILTLGGAGTGKGTHRQTSQCLTHTRAPTQLTPRPTAHAERSEGPWRGLPAVLTR